MSALADLEYAKKQLEDAQKKFEDAEAKAKAIADTQKDLETLMKTHGVSAQDLVELLFFTYGGLKTPGALQGKGGAKAGGTRKIQVYINPHTNEKVETRGANHKTLKAWREQYGADTVRGWKVE